jgi:hypothetical protein
MTAKALIEMMVSQTAFATNGVCRYCLFSICIGFTLAL